MRCRKKGEITVFLTLMLSVISAFYISLSSLARRYVSESEAAYAVECAVRSCFAEYNRELFDKYRILLIDSSFRTEEGGLERVEEHFKMYLANSVTVNTVCDALVRVNDDAVPVADKYGITDEVIGYIRENGSPGFDPLSCYDDLVFTATFSSPYTGTYSITRQYSYDPKSM